MANFSDLRGLTLKSVRIEQNDQGDEVHLLTTCGRTFVMNHHQDCCENVYIESIAGCVNDILRSPLMVAEEVISNEAQPSQDERVSGESFTWTFYKLATRAGYVDIRWIGTSNGYYSETVSFSEITH